MFETPIIEVMTGQIREKHRKSIQHFNLENHAHVLTFTCYHRLKLLDSDRSREWFLRALEAARRKYNYGVLAYVIMPEHVHVLVLPRSVNYDISDFLKSVKQSVSRNAKSYLQTRNSTWLRRLTLNRGAKSVFRFWQQGPGYDRNIISPLLLQKEMEYLHNNPVRRKLVETPDDWAWSSARHYNGQTGVPFVVDELQGLPSM